MRKIFLDIGGWNGASAIFFKKYHPSADEFEIFTFECDPKNIQTIKKKKLPINLIEAAAWSHHGKVRFYYSGSHTMAGGTMYASKITGGINPKNYYEVPCIDLAHFIISNFNKEDYIIAKLNVEGAEYVIIPHLYNAGLIEWINRWYVQWHYNKIGLSEKKHNEIMHMIPSWFEWDCQCHEETFKTKYINSL